MIPGEPALAGAAVISVDLVVEAGDWPEEAELDRLARRAVTAGMAELGLSTDAESEVSLVFTDDAHIRTLNASWRDKDRPTNVLSFPAFPVRPGDDLPPMLGDIVIAFETVSREAALEEKPFDHHVTHLILHGFLHLLGYDHETPGEADAMEAIERRALARLAIPDPYA